MISGTRLVTVIIFCHHANFNGIASFNNQSVAEKALANDGHTQYRFATDWLRTGQHAWRLAAAHFLILAVLGELPMTASLPPIRLAGRTLSHTNHICAFFNSREEQNKILMPFFKDGYDQGEKLFHVVDSNLHEDHRCACRQGGIQVDTAEASGQLEIHDWEETYLKDGYFDADRMIGIVEDMLATNHPHFQRIRVTGNMEWALKTLPGVKDVIEYETKLNYVLPKYPDAFVCVYDLNRHSGSVVMDILRTHPMVIIAGVLQENPLYVPPDEFMRELRRRKGGREQVEAAAPAA